MAEKYPHRFADASHGLVARASSWDHHLFVVCRITRRPEGMICIENAKGHSFTFRIQREGEKEYGHLIQAGQTYTGQTIPPKRFRVVPFNPEGKGKND
jgi:hypothetical protein